MLKDIFFFMHLKLSRLVLLTLMSVTVSLCVGCVVLPKSSSYRSFKIGLQESPQATNMTPHSKPLLEIFGWKTIKEMTQFESRIMVFKSINGLAPQYLIDLFMANGTNSLYNFRTTVTDLTIPKKISSTGQKSFSYRGARLLDSLPDQSKRATDLLSFKKSL